MALKHLVDLDLGGNEIQNVVLQNLGTAPTGTEGQIFYDTGANCVKVHTGSGFVRVGLTADGSTITESNGTISVGSIAISKVTGLQTALDNKVDDSQVLTNVPSGAVFTDTLPAIVNQGGTPELATGVTAGEIRTLIGAGTSSFNGTWGSLSGKPSTFAPSAHTHEIDEVNGLTSALNDLAPKASPALTGTPTAPTAAGGNNTTQIATTAFVTGEINRVIDAAPGALNTLNELAAAIGDDANFSTTITNQIGAKLDSSAYTAADVLAKIKTVDGAGSGLDADKLDGQSSAYYRNYNNLTNKPSIPGFEEVTVTGAGARTPLGVNIQNALIQVFEVSGADLALVMTDVMYVNGQWEATLTSGTSYVVRAIGG